MPTWIADLNLAIESHGACVLVTVARARGSTPREAGAKMVVTPDGVLGTIGGGNLEQVAIDQGLRLIGQSEPSGAQSQTISLGPSLGQCCGGSVDLLFDPIVGTVPDWVEAAGEAGEGGEAVITITTLGQDDAATRALRHGDLAGDPLHEAIKSHAQRLFDEGQPACALVKSRHHETVVLELHKNIDTPVVLFGAGHVGRSIVASLQDLPFRVTWVDQRAHEFPGDIPANAVPVVARDPVAEIDRAPPGSIYLVLTHSHPLDLALCAKILQRADFRFLGLIGSSTKRERFRRQLAQLGLAEDQLDRMTCPIGIAGIPGKTPAEIGIAVAAQLLQLIGDDGTREVPA